MQVLLFVFAGSVLALLWAAWAIRKAVRRSEERRARSSGTSGTEKSATQDGDEP